MCRNRWFLLITRKEMEINFKIATINGEVEQRGELIEYNGFQYALHIHDGRYKATELSTGMCIASIDRCTKNSRNYLIQEIKTHVISPAILDRSKKQLKMYHFHYPLNPKFNVKQVMKQTVEEAARKELFSSYACTSSKLSFSGFLYNADAMLNMFQKGAEWKAEQSPWISVEERLPKQNELVLCRMVSNGAIVSGYIFVEDKKPPRVATQGSFEFEDWNDYECDMWMSIPSFDDILDANKDVLERIKEKGD